MERSAHDDDFFDRLCAGESEGEVGQRSERENADGMRRVFQPASQPHFAAFGDGGRRRRGGGDGAVRALAPFTRKIGGALQGHFAAFQHQHGVASRCLHYAAGIGGAGANMREAVNDGDGFNGNLAMREEQ